MNTTNQQLISKLLGTLLTTLLIASPILAQEGEVGIFQGRADIGDVGQAGSTGYDAKSQVYTLEGSGDNMWFGEDAFHYLYRKISGDFILRTRAEFLENKGESNFHRKMGWVVRTSLDPGSPHVNAALHGNGLAALQFRRSPGDSTYEIRSAVTGADVVQLERQGSTYLLSVARFGDTFTTDTLVDLDLGDEVYVGLYVCAHDNEGTEQARFRNTRIVKPAGDDLVPYQDYLGSNLEMMNVDNGHRTIIYRHPQSIQAPNWTPDDRGLIYNHNGLLFYYDLQQDRPEVIDTDFAINNNNDHVLTLDGTMLGISHHTEDAGGASIVYTMPAEGGVPRRVTEKGPSYLHGWSPDNRFLTYTGLRNDEYDIYIIPAEGGEEIRLTTAPGLDDGSEYTPDGRYIYFNSVRTGSMEIWRMRPDGTEQEQLTDDRLNNWFPHISPDGRRVVFLSYPETVAPSDHPFYKRVYLRMMPLDGGEPRVIAYLYGGQGTINVPSWAPDSRRISFVSNTGLN
ncbi:MAG: hypothetical protein R3224_06760 [Balneolaceae bacterium]|nr:hypothetical protein [Balneolaceae bacterium]